jgi:Ca-activated chloride channel family protein
MRFQTSLNWEEIEMSRYLRSLLAMIMFLCLLPGLSVARAQQILPGDPPSPQGGQRAIKPEGPSTQRPAQDNGAEGDPVLKLSTEVVTLNVTVTDKHHNMVGGLEAQHFEVYEDKILQKIEFFNNVEAPVSIGIVFDVSLSMKGRLNRARAALKSFIDTSHRDDDFFLIPFDHRPQLIGESADGESAERLLSEVEAGGSTALYDAVYLGAESVKRGRHKKQALLVISDGQDNSSFYSYGDLRRLLKESDVQVYSIGITESAWMLADYIYEEGRMILTDLTKVTGGKAFFPRLNKELDEAMARIAMELRQQYSIGYIPANFSRDGKWRKIKVRVNPPPEMPRLIIRTREGYFADH